MRPIGFSTGALALGDFRAGLRALLDAGVPAVELSALRAHELAPLLTALGAPPRSDTPDTKATQEALAQAPRSALEQALACFAYVSVHAPSRYPAAEESQIAARLDAVVVRGRGWPVVVHPDAIADPVCWRPLGPHLLIENMDLRKTAGKTTEELATIFAQLPQAGMCFDIGHAHQVDPSMAEAASILRRFGGRLRQLHMSVVNKDSKHRPLDAAAIAAFQKVAGLIATDVPLILETPIGGLTSRAGLLAEMSQAQAALNRA